MCLLLGKSFTMNKSDIHTYKSVRIMYNKKQSPDTIACTLDQLRDICRFMEQVLPGTKLQVEGIGGGGIEFMNVHYKSIRFNAHDFPWIHDVNSTKGSFSLTRPRSKTMSVFLKSFHDAPAFTRKELWAYKIALQFVVLDPLLRSQQGMRGWRHYSPAEIEKKLPRAQTLTATAAGTSTGDT